MTFEPALLLTLALFCILPFSATTSSCPCCMLVLCRKGLELSWHPLPYQGEGYHGNPQHQYPTKCGEFSMVELLVKGYSKYIHSNLSTKDKRLGSWILSFLAAMSENYLVKLFECAPFKRPLIPIPIKPCQRRGIAMAKVSYNTTFSLPKAYFLQLTIFPCNLRIR